MRLNLIFLFCDVLILISADAYYHYHGGYSRYHGGWRRINNHRHANHQSTLNNYHRDGKSVVTMPSGGTSKIVKPRESRYTCSKKSDLLTMKPTDKMWKNEYNTVKREMERTNTNKIVRYHIIKIQKIFNPCLWRKYSYRRDVVYDEAKLTNEKMLFHGSAAAKELALHGFDERYAKTTGRFGAGVYFADRSSKSHTYSRVQPDGYRYMLLCRVTLGKTHQATVQFKRIGHAPVGYHSVMASLNNNEYIVYRGEQAYPAYLITYK